MADRSDWSLLHAHLHQTLRSRPLLPAHQRVLVAVSGGQDSLCLIKLLWDLQRLWHWELAIAHCDHRWRDDSQANGDHVQTLAKTWGLPFYLATASVELNSEAAARTWRYETLTEIAQTYQYSLIVTGHTASDRAETLLYNLIRGSGLDGLQALTWQRPLTPNIQLVRPLLSLTRQDTADFCQQFQLVIWDDSTNQNLDYRRNRIRQELLPYLKAHFNPQVETSLAQTAELIQAEVEYLEQQATERRSRLQHPDKAGLNRSHLQTLPLALQRRIIRQFLAQQLPQRPNFAQIEKLTALITAPNHSRTDPFPGGAIAWVEQDWIWLQALT